MNKYINEHYEGSAEKALQGLSDSQARYNVVERSLLAKLAALTDKVTVGRAPSGSPRLLTASLSLTRSVCLSVCLKVPEITASLEACKMLKESNEEIHARFELNDTLYTMATIKPTESVNLWLGVRHMDMRGRLILNAYSFL